MITTGTAFPSLKEIRRRAIPGPVNPMDKSTIVSIYPKDITAQKLTLSPEMYFIPKGSVEHLGILVVGTARWWKDTSPEEPLIEIPVSSPQVAESIVNDYCNGIFGCDMEQSKPGLFWIPGAFTADKVKKEFPHLIEQAVERQRIFYRNLIKHADSLWARSNGNPLVISDDMRMAAVELGQRDKDWMADHRSAEMVRCNACGSMKNPKYPVCATCKAIDHEHPGAKGIKFAQ